MSDLSPSPCIDKFTHRYLWLWPCDSHTMLTCIPVFFFCMRLPSINHLVNSWRGKRGHLCGILLPPLIQAMVQNSVIPTGFTVLLKTACGLFRQHSSAGQ